MGEKSIATEIIEGYHRVIYDRYQYEKIKSCYAIPDSINEERFNALRSYFLNYLYPSEQKRKDLNDAFESLDNHINHPDQLLRIIIDSGNLIFKYGWHLPKVLKAGIKALKSFRFASKFEVQLVDEARNLELQPPFYSENIFSMMRGLSRGDVNKFMDNAMSLFETLYDQPLVEKIIEIVDHIIGVMQKRPSVYSEEEIKGLELGREVIVEGNKLFIELSAEEQSRLFTLIYQIEKDAIEEIFSSDHSR